VSWAVCFKDLEKDRWCVCKRMVGSSGELYSSRFHVSSQREGLRKRTTTNRRAGGERVLIYRSAAGCSGSSGDPRTRCSNWRDSGRSSGGTESSGASSLLAGLRQKNNGLEAAGELPRAGGSCLCWLLQEGAKWENEAPSDLARGSPGRAVVVVVLVEAVPDVARGY
jgi:hypothetical protein